MVERHPKTWLHETANGSRQTTTSARTGMGERGAEGTLEAYRCRSLTTRSLNNARLRFVLTFCAGALQTNRARRRSGVDARAFPFFMEQGRHAYHAICDPICL
jgi:hypothetical protein